MQRYLRPDLLADAGIPDFDTWAATFGQTTTEMEISPSGAAGGKRPGSPNSATSPSSCGCGTSLATSRPPTTSTCPPPPSRCAPTGPGRRGDRLRHWARRARRADPDARGRSQSGQHAQGPSWAARDRLGQQMCEKWESTRSGATPSLNAAEFGVARTTIYRHLSSDRWGVPNSSASPLPGGHGSAGSP